MEKEKGSMEEEGAREVWENEVWRRRVKSVEITLFFWNILNKFFILENCFKAKSC